MNSNSKTKFEFKQRRRKEKQKKKKREEASLWPRPARLHGPASPTGLPTPSQRARVAASWPAHELGQAQHPTRTPLTPTRLPAFACSRCRTGPMCQPSLFIFSTLTATASDQAPIALAGAGQGVTPGAWPCLLGATPTKPRATIGCIACLSTERSPPPMEAWSSAIKARPRLP